MDAGQVTNLLGLNPPWSDFVLGEVVPRLLWK